VSARARCAVVVLVVATSTHCVPTLSGSDSLITKTRILAIKAEPAEGAPGAKATFSTLVASPGGSVSGAPIAWDFCTAPKPIVEDNVVSNACLGSSALVPAGAGPSTTTNTPAKGCSLFGPDTASTGFRPRDPDSTGGFYQPLRAELSGAADAFALTRIHCDLPNASADAASAFAKAYRLNQNPTLQPLTATMNGAPVALGAITAGAHVTLQASWPASSAETFAYFDPSSQTVTTQRESMQVAWYSSDGSFDTESTGRASGDMATTSEDGFQAPANEQTTHVWIVLRDSRGGIDFASYDLVTVR
jgi:hypothetical protein